MDIILQSIGRDGTKDITFTVKRDKREEAVNILKKYSELIDGCKISFDDKVSKVSIVGAGMESYPGVAAKMFEALYTAQINIQMIATSEIKISVLIDENDADEAVAAIHDTFFNNNFS